ncbi:NACHT, LRR and PYD domains-containing protein 8 [Lepus europaeus]|uniref:NACHT, LRR and PYD domains-containing protein 8 n=1 Tax=Lepus europaeus TaxID=9983 RepID=UPI002B484EFD|nr:NACHT, LRR and PYD domains-containing protein 8 [Lepus europaeus]
MSDAIPGPSSLSSSVVYASFLPFWITSCCSTSPYDKGIMLYLLYLSKEELQKFKQLLVRREFSLSAHPAWEQLEAASWAELVHFLTQYFPGRQAWDVTHNIFAKMNQQNMCFLVQKELNALLPMLESNEEVLLKLEKEEVGSSDWDSRESPNYVGVKHRVRKREGRKQRVQAISVCLWWSARAIRAPVVVSSHHQSPHGDQLAPSEPPWRSARAIRAPVAVSSRRQSPRGDQLREYKLRVLRKFFPEWDRITWPGNCVDFFYQEVHKHKTFLPCLFLPRKPQGRPAKTIIIDGAPGIGKTTLARKLMVAWARNQFYAHKGWFVFYFQCQEVTRVGEQSCSELIERQWPGCQALVSKILSKPDQLLFLFDGFEKLSRPLFVRQRELSADWSRKLPGTVLLSSLLSKTMLPEASVLLTMRMNSWWVVRPLLKSPFFVTLRGFTMMEKIQYLRTYFGNTEEGERAVDFARRNTILFSLCRVPALCWMVGSCLRQQMQAGVDLAEACPNATAVVALYISSLFPFRAEPLPGRTHLEHLEGLCHLASLGMWSMKWVFGKEDLEEAKVDELDVSSFLGADILQEVGGEEPRYTFAFAIFQEFLAALFHVLYFPGRPTPFHLLGHGDIQYLIASPGGSRSHLAHMGMFLFGLFNVSCAAMVRRVFRCELSWGNKRKVLQTMSLLLEGDLPALCCGVPQLFYCLTEVREEDFVSQALSGYRKAVLKMQSNKDVQLSAFCLKRCRRLQEMELTLMVNFSQVWWPGPGDSLHAAEIQESDMQYQWWQDICSVLTTNEGLAVLTLTKSILEAPLVKVLAAALRHPQCKLQKLSLRHLGPSVLHKDLFCVLVENQRLSSLEIQYTEVGTEAMRDLCAALRHPQCALQCLRLEYCMAAPEDWIDLAKGLQNDIRLGSLLLRRNPLESFMANYVSASRLERLSLETCNLTGLACERLASSLQQSKMLTHLSLADNPLGDEGVKPIWKALGQLACPLQRLVLRKCALTSACCPDVVSVLSQSQTLRSLDLSFNSLMDKGVTLLCEALKNPDCSLQVLELEQCLFSSVCCSAMSSVFLSNPSLRYLDLSKNNIGLLGILTLVGGFPSHRQREEVLLERKAKEDVGMLARLSGPTVQSNYLKIVQDWNS